MENIIEEASMVFGARYMAHAATTCTRRMLSLVLCFGPGIRTVNDKEIANGVAM